jgi:hypothetical protein
LDLSILREPVNKGNQVRPISKAAESFAVNTTAVSLFLLASEDDGKTMRMKGATWTTQTTNTIMIIMRTVPCHFLQLASQMTG